MKRPSVTVEVSPSLPPMNAREWARAYVRELLRLEGLANEITDMAEKPARAVP